MKTITLATASLLSTVLASAALAQSDGTCLSNNQIASASVIDDRTLLVNDRANRTFVVRLSGVCQGLTTTSWRVRFSSPANLACLGQGDRVAFRHPTVGRNTCFVSEVSTDLGTIASIGRPFSPVIN